MNSNAMNAGDLHCQELVELVTDYLEGALSREQQARFEAHIARCAACTAYLAQMRQTIRLTGTLAESDLAPEARTDLLDIFRDWKREQPPD